MPEPATSTSKDVIESVAFVSLGCPKNLIDSEQMLGTLARCGFRLVSDHDDADAIVINTCGFLEAAKEESLEVIGEAIRRKEAGRVQRVVVAGCLVQRHRARVLEWAPGIDAMIGVFDRDHVIDAVRGRSDGSPRPSLAQSSDRPTYWIASNALTAASERGVDVAGRTVQGDDGRGLGYFELDSERLRLTPRHWAYLRVSEGCNQNCAFCTIPSIRGKMRSKPLEAIEREARALMSDGAFELNLIGQDTTSYGVDLEGERGGGLVGLLTSLDAVAREFGGGWIRLMYVYPTKFTDAMIDAIARLPNIVKYIDIPLQHITDRMLSSMRRGITRDQQERLLERLRDRIPGLVIRTTLITGFPGETEADHRALVEFIEDFRFDMLGVFQFSREEGTPAGSMDLDPSRHVPEEVKAQREAELMLAQQRIAFENARRLAEQRAPRDVLIDGAAQDEPADQSPRDPAETGSLHVGRCAHQAPEVDSLTFVRSEAPLPAGAVVPCSVVGAAEYDLIARPTEQVHRLTSLPIIP